MLQDVEYLDLFGEEPSLFEMVFAIFANVIELDEFGRITNFQHAQKRATDYLKSYCVQGFNVEPPFEGWEIELHNFQSAVEK